MAGLLYLTADRVFGPLRHKRKKTIRTYCVQILHLRRLGRERKPNRLHAYIHAAVLTYIQADKPTVTTRSE